MLRIYGVVLEVIRRLREVVDEIGTRDPRLGRQMREAMASIALNTAEGAGNIGGHKRERYQTALGSARETVACIDTAVALGYVGALDVDTAAMLDQVIGTLVNLVVRRR